MSKRFVLSIEWTDHARFVDDWTIEVDRILLDVIHSHGRAPEYRTGMLRDGDGNMVGRWDVYDTDEVSG